MHGKTLCFGLQTYLYANLGSGQILNVKRNSEVNSVIKMNRETDKVLYNVFGEPMVGMKAVT